MASTCKVEFCGREVYLRAEQVCRTHYRRLVKTGTTDSWRPDAWARFDQRVNKDGPAPTHDPSLGPCWLWEGGQNGGYGAFRAENGKSVRAHRYAYEREHSIRLATDAQIDHLCRRRNCVRPSHLEPVSAQTNCRRRSDAQETCLSGTHPLPPADVHGRRKCRLCVNERQSRYARRKRAAARAAGDARSAKSP